MNTKISPKAKEIMEDSIKRKLIAQKKVTDKQVMYIKNFIEPKFENDCSICRLNVMLYLNVDEDIAFKNQTLK